MALYKPLPDCLTIKESPIEGLGMFATKDIKKDTNLGLSHVVLNHNPKESYPYGLVDDEEIVTPLGGFKNHSNDPNCKIFREGNRYYNWTIKDIKVGDELTLDYGRWYCGEPCPECFEKKKDKS